MKIDMDVERIIAGKNRTDIKKAVLKYMPARDAGGMASLKNSQLSVQNLSRKRALIDALVISQMAQGFMQRALLICSRLKTAASEAIISGGINRDEITEIFSDIKSSLHKMRESSGHLTNISSAQAFIDIPVEDRPVSKLPQIEGEFNFLKEFAAVLSSGVKPDLAKLENIQDSLREKSVLVENAVNQLRGSFDAYCKKTPGIDSSELTSRCGDLILKNPDMAFISQGNLNYQKFKNFITE